MSLTKRIDQARKAFASSDLRASAQAHLPKEIMLAAREEHGRASDQYIGNMVYGGLDGIVTTFAVVSGVAGAQLGLHVVLIMGLANLFADGFAMAIGAYLSSKSQQEYFEREKEREAWEVEHFPDGERAELQQVYRSRGYGEDETRQLVEIQTRDRERWVKAMMIDELGMMADDRKPLSGAAATLISFVAAGSIPLLVYLVGLFAPVPAGVAFPVSLVLSALALFGLGAAKVFITERNFARSGLEMLLVGGLAAGVAYLIGALLKGIGG